MEKKNDVKKIVSMFSDINAAPVATVEDYMGGGAVKGEESPEAGDEASEAPEMPAPVRPVRRQERKAGRPAMDDFTRGNITARVGVAELEVINSIRGFVAWKTGANISVEDVIRVVVRGYLGRYKVGGDPAATEEYLRKKGFFE